MTELEYELLERFSIMTEEGNLSDLEALVRFPEPQRRIIRRITNINEG